VTGSGKTEVYLAAIREALEQGKGAIFLIPEIALTVAMISKFRERLGDLLAVLHSRLKPRDRYQEWARIRSGEARVVLGPRSAAFAPVQELGLMILDEEQEGSFKQQDKPRYHAREVACWRGEEEGFPVVLGTATPTLESFHRAKAGEYLYHRLGQRFRQATMPPVELVDMSLEFREKRNRSIFSMRLKESLDSTLEAGGQAILFLNRRGFHTYVFCRGCGYVHECRNCSVALTFHFHEKICLCHHCAFRTEAPRVCPACGSKAIRYAGSGTQRVAREFQVSFPETRFLRMDSDTTRQRGSHERILDSYNRGQTRVLIGTQMLAKGFDFPHLNLVGVINADSGLTLPDFRGAEKTFQLITQVAGRVGRGDEAGHVVVQTYRPDHYALQHARLHDYEGFADRELALRKELFYPPFSRLLLAVLEAPEEVRARDPLEELRSYLETQLGDLGRIRILGPAPAPLMKLEGRYRQQLLVKIETGDEACVALRQALRKYPNMPRGIRLDMDPQHLL
jgi:primosomal protein N' (replication factor Y)